MSHHVGFLSQRHHRFPAVLTEQAEQLSGPGKRGLIIRLMAA